MNSRKFIWWNLVVIVFVILVSCARTQNNLKDNSMIPTSIIDEASTKWISLDGVEGVAEGEKDGKPCIMVLVSVEPETLTDQIPLAFKGYPVVVEKTGEIKAY